MNLIESLEGKLGRPLFDLDGAAVCVHRQPIVYLWLRDEAVLYIGQSRRGTDRPLGAGHERLCDIEPGDRLVVFAVKTARLALLWEARLIKWLSPQLNAGGQKPGLALNLRALENEEKRLTRQLAGVQAQIGNLQRVQDEREARRNDLAEKALSRFNFDIQNRNGLSLQQAAKRYNVTRKTIEYAVRAGTLRHVRFGVHLRFMPEWIEEWLMLSVETAGELRPAAGPAADR